MTKNERVIDIIREEFMAHYRTTGIRELSIVAAPTFGVEDLSLTKYGKANNPSFPKMVVSFIGDRTAIASEMCWHIVDAASKEEVEGMFLQAGFDKWAAFQVEGWHHAIYPHFIKEFPLVEFYKAWTAAVDKTDKVSVEGVDKLLASTSPSIRIQYVWDTENNAAPFYRAKIPALSLNGGYRRSDDPDLVLIEDDDPDVVHKQALLHSLGIALAMKTAKR